MNRLKKMFDIDALVFGNVHLFVIFVTMVLSESRCTLSA